MGRRRADQHVSTAYAAHGEQARIQQLMTEIEAARATRINEWADTNAIIVLYPQAHATDVSELASQNFLSLFNANLERCRNWWGYGADTQFLTKQGVQISAIWSMVLRVTGQLN
jgi:hypothetical protein